VKKRDSKSKNIKTSFDGKRVTKYSGLIPIVKYMNKLKLSQQLNDLFPTENHNATKFSNFQLLLAVILASLVGVNRFVQIAMFSYDPLLLILLGLSTGLNKDVISVRLKQLGQAGAVKLHEHLFGLTTQWLEKTRLTSITLDVDSSVKTVYGNQQGAQVGFNTQKKGAKSYHPVIAFLSETKIVLNSWFRCGSAYTSNGICEFIKQTKAILPATVKDVFFRADSGFFNGALFDLLEKYHWTYLVKVKLKNLKKLLAKQAWLPLKDGSEICEFEYKANSWQKTRKLKAIRFIKEHVQADFMGTKQLIPIYDYFCYCSNLDLNALELHELYKQRSTSETWIEQVKSQLLAGATLTNNFHANDIMWQLNVLAYNLSVMMRFKFKRFWREEHATFRNWFINVPAQLVTGGHQIRAKIYKNYYFKNRWLQFDELLQSA